LVEALEMMGCDCAEGVSTHSAICSSQIAREALAKFKEES